jgi:hypothetical protein
MFGACGNLNLGRQEMPLAVRRTDLTVRLCELTVVLQVAELAWIDALKPQLRLDVARGTDIGCHRKLGCVQRIKRLRKTVDLMISCDRYNGTCRTVDSFSRSHFAGHLIECELPRCFTSLEPCIVQISSSRNVNSWVVAASDEGEKADE